MKTTGALSILLFSLLLWNCGGDSTPTAPTSTPTPVATLITLSEVSLSFASLGATSQLSATVKDQNGRDNGECHGDVGYIGRCRCDGIIHRSRHFSRKWYSQDQCDERVCRRGDDYSRGKRPPLPHDGGGRLLGRC